MHDSELLNQFWKFFFEVIYLYTVSTKKLCNVCSSRLWPRISPTNLGPFSKLGTVLETSKHADYKTFTNFENLSRFLGNILSQRQLVQTSHGFFCGHGV